MNFETAFREYFERNDFAKKYSHRIWPLNIIFMAPNATTDETQFDLHPEDVDWNHYHVKIWNNAGMIFAGKTALIRAQ